MFPLSVLLVDDHEIVRLGLRSLIDRHTQFKVIAEAAAEVEAVEKACTHEPEIVLMDIRLSAGCGINACKEIVTRRPQTKVVMLTSYMEDDLLLSSIRAGAVGYVLKEVGSHELIKTLEAVARGESPLDPTLTNCLFAEVRRSLRKEEIAAFEALSNKEMRVLQGIAQGKTNREIGEQLFLSEGTIRNYVSHILAKLEVSNRAEAAAYAIQHRLQNYL